MTSPAAGETCPRRAEDLAPVVRIDVDLRQVTEDESGVARGDVPPVITSTMAPFRARCTCTMLPKVELT